MEVRSCSRCPLYSTRTKVVFGVGDPTADLMIVGEGPGREEDLAGEPFVGRSGKLLDELLLEEVQLRRQQCYIANVVKCRPPGNRDPKPDEVESCRPYLEEQLRLVNPRVVLTLGRFAAQLLIGSKEGVKKLRGHIYQRSDHLGQNSDRGFWIVPTYHPSAVLRAGGGVMLAEMRADLVRAKEALSSSFPSQRLA